MTSTRRTPDAPRIVVPDEHDVADLRRWCWWGLRYAVDPAVHLRLEDGVLALTFGLITPGVAGLDPGGAGTVTAVRHTRVLPPSDPIDAVVPTRAVLDRLQALDAGRAGTGARAPEWPLPPTRLVAAWAGMAPPRSGWRRVETPDPLHEVAAGQAARTLLADPAQDATWWRCGRWGRLATSSAHLIVRGMAPAPEASNG